MNRKGFTLIELMIVIAIIAIIAAIAIPGLLRARISANEGSAIGSLRTISTCQAQFQSSANVDQDTDGTGEFAVMNELTGAVKMRASAMLANPSYVTKALSTADLTYGGKSGYHFKIYLPGALTGSNAVISDLASKTSADAPPAAVPADANFQEVKWRCYAWPISAKTSGNRAFAIDQAGEVYATANQDTATTLAVFSGTTLPAYNDACLSGASETVEMDYSITKGAGTSSQNWAPAN